MTPEDNRRELHELVLRQRIEELRKNGQEERVPALQRLRLANALRGWKLPGPAAARARKKAKHRAASRWQQQQDQARAQRAVEAYERSLQ